MVDRILIIAALSTLGLPSAAQIYVPGDYPNLQAAISGALPGDVILNSLNSGPVVITKPLTILGNPAFTVASSCSAHAVTLAGPGSGTVSMAGCTVGSGADCSHPQSGVAGGGFDELHLLDIDIDLAFSHSGLSHGNEAIDVDIPLLLVSECTIKAVGSDTDDACSGFVHDDDPAGIRAPNSQVILLDSTVLGGETKFLCCVSCTCPALPDPTLGGYGGPGVVAQSVYVVNSEVSGGQGASYLAYPSGTAYFPEGNPLHCMDQKDGPDYVVGSFHPLYDSLSGPPSVPPGGIYQLTTHLWGFTPGGGTPLFASLGAGTPTSSTFGWIFLDLASTVFLGPAPTSGLSTPVVLDFPVPADAALYGLEFGFQAIDGIVGGLTRPVFAVVAP